MDKNGVFVPQLYKSEIVEVSNSEANRPYCEKLMHQLSTCFSWLQVDVVPLNVFGVMKVADRCFDTREGEVNNPFRTYAYRLYSKGHPVPCRQDIRSR